MVERDPLLSIIDADPDAVALVAVAMAKADRAKMAERIKASIRAACGPDYDPYQYEDQG